MAALVGTCPTSELPPEHQRARAVLRRGYDATDADLREVSKAAVTALEQGTWDQDRTWVVEVALDPVRRLPTPPEQGNPRRTTDTP